MPIYEHACTKHGVFETLVSSWRERKDTRPCPKCKRASKAVVSLCAMDPDDSWHFGTRVQDKQYSSRSAAKQAMKESGIARVEPGMTVGKKGQGDEVRRRLHIEKHLEGYAV